MNYDTYITEKSTRDEIVYSVYAYLRKCGVDLNADNYDWYADFCFVVDKYVNNKLSVWEIMYATDKLSDLLLGQPQSLKEFGMILTREQRITGQIRALDLLPSLKDKGLTYEEKEALAFCIYYVCCITKMDEDTHQLISTVAEFKDFKKIDAEYQWTKAMHKELFQKVESENSGDYGYDINNPINVCSVKESYDFLKSLKTSDGSIADIERVGSMKGTTGDFIDKWKITIEKDDFAETKFLYINCYSFTNEWIAPQGFYL